MKLPFERSNDLSVLGALPQDDDTGRFGRMRGQMGERCVAPIRKAYHLAGVNLHFGPFDCLQYAETLGIEKERVVPK